MKKLFAGSMIVIALAVWSCDHGNPNLCETDNLGAVKFSDPNNGYNPDSIVIFLGSANLGMIRLLGDLTVSSLPVGTYEFTFKYQGDTLFMDSITVTQCTSTNYTINFFPISDKRLKDHIQPLPDVLASLLQLNTYSFEYNRQQFPNYPLPKGTHLGFMAQELQKDFPSAVVPFRDGYYAVNYYEMVPVLTKAIQEQQAEINGLKKEVEELKKMLPVQQSTAMK